MEINNELVEHIAHLARLEFQGAEKDAIKADMTKMLDFVDQLSAVDTDNVEPLIFMTESVNVLREDKAVVSVSQEDALKNASHKDSDYFKIAKVLKK